MVKYFLPLLIVAGLSAGSAHAAPAKGAAASQTMVARAQAALDQGKTQAAIDQFEAALALDPGNVMAYIGLGRAHAKADLSGKAVRYYREALNIDPNDLIALEEQGAVLAERGATQRAQINLARIRTICKSECLHATRLASTIDKAVTAQKASTAAAEKPQNSN